MRARENLLIIAVFAMLLPFNTFFAARLDRNIETR